MLLSVLASKRDWLCEPAPAPHRKGSYERISCRAKKRSGVKVSHTVYQKKRKPVEVLLDCVAAASGWITWAGNQSTNNDKPYEQTQLLHLSKFLKTLNTKLKTVHQVKPFFCFFSLKHHRSVVYTVHWHNQYFKVRHCAHLSSQWTQIELNSQSSFPGSG